MVWLLQERDSGAFKLFTAADQGWLPNLEPTSVPSGPQVSMSMADAHLRFTGELLHGLYIFDIICSESPVNYYTLRIYDITYI